MIVTDEQIKLLLEWRDAWGTVQWARLCAQEVTPQMEDAVYQASCELHDTVATDWEDAQAALPSTADVLAIIREIAASDPIIYAEAEYDSGDDFRACRYCMVHQVGQQEIPHALDCLWQRSRHLAARLPPEGE